MNINFERALKDIDAQQFDSAISELNTAISFEIEHGRPDDAEQYRCVLAELLANLSRITESMAEFEKVLEYCNKTNSLPKQKKIAEAFLKRFKTPASVHNTKRRKTISANALKPHQNRAFISQQLNKRK